MSCEAHYHTRENIICPKCSRPISVFRGVDANCKPIWTSVHRVDLKTWRPGTVRFA